MFTPEQFLDVQIDGANSTETIPIPVGDYLGVIEKVEPKQWAKKDDPSVCGMKLQVTWSLDDANLKELLGRDKVTLRQDIMLDITESGMLDMGKGRNVGLGRLREAVGLNTPGQAFSFRQLPGRMARVQTKQRVDGTTIYSEVAGAAALS